MSNRPILTVGQATALAGILATAVPNDLLEERAQALIRGKRKLRMDVAALLRGEVLAQVKPAVQPQTRLVWRGKVASLQVTIDYDKSIEDLVAEVKASGWTINSSITTGRRLDFEGMPQKPAGKQTRNLSVVSSIKAGEVWKTNKVLDKLGASGLAFNFHCLCEWLKYRDELMSHGVKYMIAMGSRFRASVGHECVAYLYLANRNVRLHWIDLTWLDDVSFGRARNS